MKGWLASEYAAVLFENDGEVVGGGYRCQFFIRGIYYLSRGTWSTIKAIQPIIVSHYIASNKLSTVSWRNVLPIDPVAQMYNKSGGV